MLKSINLFISFVIISFVLYLFINFESAESKPIFVNFDNLSTEAKEQVTCLAENIYFEARSEPIEGMIAVAFVTMNRVYHGKYPNTICEVVKQKARIEKIGDRRVVCQFSWWCEPTPHHISSNSLLTKDFNRKYNEILQLSLYFYANYDKIEDPTNGAIFYHADYVNPNWRNVTKTITIGRHIFYEDKQNGNI